MGEVIAIIAVIGGVFLGGIAIVFGTHSYRTRVRELEQTRRELAAYVAEGSMSVADAERILNAGRPAWEQSQIAKAARVRATAT